MTFGGSLNRVDREKTGPLKVLREKDFLPGPCSYAVEAEEQVRPGETVLTHGLVVEDAPTIPERPTVPLLHRIQDTP